MGLYEEFQAEVDQLQFCRGEALLQQVRRVIAVAEKYDDLDAQAEWYQHLLRAGSDQGRFDYELSAFAALRTLYETHDRFRDLRGMLLWHYKWIVDRLPEHVEVSLDMIETVFRQMTAFYEKEGESLRPVYSLRCRCYAFLSHKEKAAEYFKLWQETEASASDDCAACQTDAKVNYYLAMGEPQKAFEAAEPVMTGEQVCDEVPIITFSRLLTPMMFAGHEGLAERMQRAVVRPVRRVPKFTANLAQHVVYLTLSGRAAEASRLAKLLLGRGTKRTNSYYRIASWRAAWLWAAVMRHEGHTTVHVPAGTFDEGPARVMDIAEVVDRCYAQAHGLAQAFDRRAGAEQFMPSIVGLQKFLESIAKSGPADA